MNKMGILGIAIAGAFVIGFSLQPAYGPIIPPKLDDRNFGGVIGYLQKQIDALESQIDSFFDIFTELRTADENLQIAIDEEGVQRIAGDANLQSQIDAIQGQPGPVQIYEVSGVSVIPAGQTFGNMVQLRCLGGDRYLDDNPVITITVDPTIIENYFIGIRSDDALQVITNIPGITDGNEIVVGYDVRTRNDGEKPPFDIPVTVTGLCLSP